MKRRWYYRPRGYAFGLGPIVAKNEREARAWFREWLKVPRLTGEVWQG